MIFRMTVKICKRNIAALFLHFGSKLIVATSSTSVLIRSHHRYDSAVSRFAVARRFREESCNERLETLRRPTRRA